ncbi:hypothetical protein BHM03_00055596 [Ensete ventricosum]|nr:hypothetical protein BHM03_00055596 [Ensete ventricosum]
MFRSGAVGSSTSVNNATIRRAVDSMGECHGTTEAGLPCIVTGELDYFSAHIRLREPGKSEDKADGVEVGGRKGRGSDDESSEAQLPKSKASVRKEVDLNEHHSAAEVDLSIVKEGMQIQGNR